MIVAKIDELEKYESVLPCLAKAQSFLAKFAKDGLPENGKYETDDERIFYNVCEYETVAENSKQFEVHAKYADVQVVVEGKELCFYASQKFDGVVDAEKDISFTDAKTTDTTELVPGVAAIYLPGELHKPGCAVGGVSEKVKKIIFKVKV